MLIYLISKIICFILTKLNWILGLRKIKVVIIGKIVATTKDQNNNAVEIQDANKDASNKTPIKILFSNVKLGKNNKPPTNPAITDNRAILPLISCLNIP